MPTGRKAPKPPLPRKTSRGRSATPIVTGPGAVYLIAYTPNNSASVQTDHPATKLSAYLLDVPDGQDSSDVVGAFVSAQQFAPTTVFGVVDATTVDALVLSPTLEPGDTKPGESTS